MAFVISIAGSYSSSRALTSQVVHSKLVFISVMGLRKYLV